MILTRIPFDGIRMFWVSGKARVPIVVTNGHIRRATASSIAICATLVATTLGTLAAVGLSRPQMPYRRPIMALLISPLIVPIIITAAGMFFFYSKVGLAYSHLGVILAQCCHRYAIRGHPGDSHAMWDLMKR